MNSDDWHDVLTLMAMVIMADRRIYKEEVDTFVSCVNKLNEIISPDIFMPQSMALEWFKANRDRVKNMMIGKNAQRNIREVILKAGRLPYKKDFVKCMRTIAQADNEYHNNEHHVIKQAAYHWKVAI